MICFVAPADETDLIEEYLHQYGTHLLHRVKIVTYEEIAAGTPVPVGTYIFAAVDRLFPQEREIATQFRQELSRVDPNITVLNDPGEVLGRYELLTTCFEQKRNRYRIFRGDEFLHCRKFPVFIRPEHEHTGSMTRLLYSPRELLGEVGMTMIRGHRLRDVIIVEFCDTADPSGVYRLHCASIVGKKIIPQVIVHNLNWVTKWKGRLADEEKVREQANYIEGNPHAAWLKETFELARINYGRLDYGLVDGVPQVWEINMNPTIVRLPSTPPTLTPEQANLFAPMRTRFLQQLCAAFLEVDSEADSNRTVRIEISSRQRRRLEAERKLKFQLRTRDRVRLEAAVAWLFRQKAKVFPRPPTARPVKKD